MKRILILLMTFLLVISCSNSEEEPRKDILIEIKGNTVTVADYRKALEIAKTGYQHNFTQNKKSISFVKERLLKQMTEELLLKTYASENNIVLTPSELEMEINNIKSEYPDNVFDKMLLENAVSYETWKERLRVRLLMEKVIKLEIAPKIQITSADMREFYEKYYKSGLAAADNEMAKVRQENTNALLVKLLRKRKTEELYNKWIEEIKIKYNVTINHDLWKKITN